MSAKTGLLALEISRYGGRVNRAVKSGFTRKAIVDAAELVVGEVGYQNASVSEITRRAGVALGTFYRHFATREELFDELLPEVGQKMLEYIKVAIKGSNSALEIERRGIQAYFDFLIKHPGFLRILNEAETLAPRAYEAHLKNLSRKYIASLRRSKARGELARLRDDELETLADVLMSARVYIASRMLRRHKRRLPNSVIQTYMTIIQGAFEEGKG